MILNIVIVLAALIAISEFADMVVYGGFVKEKNFDRLSQKLNESCFSSAGMIHFNKLEFACKKWGVTSRWYLHKDGEQKRIFITSKMNKILDEKYRQLRKEEFEKKDSLFI